MRTALCLYGHFRCFDNCWNELYQNLIIPNNITDIFVASWTDSMGWFQHPEDSQFHKSHPGYDISSEKPNAEYIFSVLERLKPKHTTFVDYAVYDPQFTRMIENLQAWHHPSVSHRPKGTLGQVWSRCAAIGMKSMYEQRNKFVYDSVVVTRWDIAHAKPIDLSKLDNSVITMDGMYGPHVISDAWACGPSHLIDLWGKQFSAIDDLVGLQTMNLGPHEWLRSHFELFEIPYKNDASTGIWIRR